MAHRPHISIVVTLLIALALIGGVVWALSVGVWPNRRLVVSVRFEDDSPAMPSVEDEPLPTITPVATPFGWPDTVATPEGYNEEAAASPSPSGSPSVDSADSGKLLVPVAGIRPEDLQDTYNDARSGGREHDAIDIMAAHGTPVLAVTDGLIVKLFQSERGGTTIYQLDPDNRTVYYYAHLDRYADNLAEGHLARRGEVIGYVGNTGNSGAGNYHLHFSVSIVSDPKRWWSGTNVNPYPLLTQR